MKNTTLTIMQPNSFSVSPHGFISGHKVGYLYGLLRSVCGENYEVEFVNKDQLRVVVVEHLAQDIYNDLFRNFTNVATN